MSRGLPRQFLTSNTYFHQSCGSALVFQCGSGSTTLGQGWSGSRVLMTKKGNFYSWKNPLFFNQNLYSTSKHEISSLFSFYVGHLCPPGSRCGSGSTRLIFMNKYQTRQQCGGSGMFIPDPGSEMFIPDPGSWFLPIPDPGSRIPDPKTATKERDEKKFM
jgi:hypothetical protein